MNDVFAFTVTRANTPERARLLQDTITQARRTAACDFDWHIWESGCSEEGLKVLQSALATKAVQEVHYCHENVGQHVAWNEAYAMAEGLGASYFLRLDDDVEFKTKRWLKKLIEASVLFDDKFVISPSVRGLSNPPMRSQVVDVKTLPVEFLRAAIGGICRFHPMDLIKDYVSDVRLPLGSGDATGIANYCRERVIPFVYVKHVRIRHAKTTKGQEASDAEYFSTHGIFQHIPYIPPWGGHVVEGTSRGTDETSAGDEGVAS